MITILKDVFYSQIGEPDEAKFRIGVLGGLYATEPQTREFLLDIAERLKQGIMMKTKEALKTMSSSVIELIPIFDHKPDPTKMQFDCYTTNTEEFPAPLLIATEQHTENVVSKMIWDIVLKRHFDLIIILEGGGYSLRYVQSFCRVDFSL